MIQDTVFPNGDYLKAEKANQIVGDILKCLSGKGISIAIAKEILREVEVELDNVKV